VDDRKPDETPAEPQKLFRAKLAQGRSRETRRRIVKAALQLWTSRGFDQGFDETTVDEIADHAGVSRATVYYYFPRKEDILGEMAWVTADEIYESTLRALMSGQTIDQTLDELMGLLGAKVSRTSRAALSRMLGLQKHEPDLRRDGGAGGLSRAFSVAITHAQEHGELPRGVSAVEVAEVLSSVCMGCIQKWAILGDFDLAPTLRRRVALVLAGARHSGAEAVTSLSA
jgi:AcrR family transcriptional regulator